jgi:hypothetical protein
MVSLYTLWYKKAQHIEDGIVQGYDRMARSIARRPILLILAMSVVAAICGIGLLKIEVYVYLFVEVTLPFLTLFPVLCIFRW